MELATRRVHFAGCTTGPDEPWMKRIACNLTNFEDGFLNGKESLLMDRDTKLCDYFRSILQQSGIEPVLLSPRSPNRNAHLERFFRSLTEECLERMIFFRENSLRNGVQEYLEHYHTERNHQGLDNRILKPGEEVGAIAGKIECRDCLGGMLRYYYCDAA